MNNVQRMAAKAVELWKDPAKRTTGAYARNSRGVSVGFASPDAVCWCAVGLLDKTMFFDSDATDDDKILYMDKLKAKLVISHIGELIQMNDAGGSDEIFEAFQQIAAEES